MTWLKVNVEPNSMKEKWFMEQLATIKELGNVLRLTCELGEIFNRSYNTYTLTFATDYDMSRVAKYLDHELSKLDELDKVISSGGNIIEHYIRKSNNYMKEVVKSLNDPIFGDDMQKSMEKVLDEWKDV